MDSVTPASAKENVARNQLDQFERSIRDELRRHDPRDIASVRRLRKLLRRKERAEEEYGKAVRDNMSIAQPRQRL